MSYKRGEIYYIDRSVMTVGSEQTAGRPAVIVSNDKGNVSSSTVEVVYLTTAPKRDLPTHVLIRSAARESMAICEQITTVAIDRIGNFKGKVTDREMEQIEIAMMISLDIKVGQAPAKEVIKEVPVPAVPTVKEAPVIDQETVNELHSVKLALAAAEAKAEMLQAMYADLLSRTMGVRA